MAVARRSPRLRVLDRAFAGSSGAERLQPPIPRTSPWRPRTRGDCEPGGPLYERPCPHTWCRQHLWRVDSCDRKGRPPVPREVRGVALLDDPPPETCALDIVDANPDGVDSDEVARLLGVGRRQSERLLVKAQRAQKRQLSKL